MEKIWIRDGKIWIRDKHPGSATLLLFQLQTLSPVSLNRQITQREVRLRESSIAAG
jgi:hypothetical protein